MILMLMSYIQNWTYQSFGIYSEGHLMGWVSSVIISSELGPKTNKQNLNSKICQELSGHEKNQRFEKVIFFKKILFYEKFQQLCLKAYETGRNREQTY